MERTPRWKSGRPLYHAGTLEGGITKPIRYRPPKVRVRGKDPRMRSNELFDRFQLGNKALASLLELANLGPQYEELIRVLRSDSDTGYKEVGEVTRLVGRWVDEIIRCPENVLRTVYTPMAEVFALFVRTSCSLGVNRRREVVEALARLVPEDDRSGSTELVS